jgi:hypothetical protein
MNTMNTISVILPIHQLDEETKPLFDNAIKSVQEQLMLPSELLIVVPKGSDVSEYVKSYDFGVIKSIVTIAENEGETDFATQFNYGVSTAKSEWVSLLEYDDEYEYDIDELEDYSAEDISEDLFTEIDEEKLPDFMSKINESLDMFKRFKKYN